MERFFRYVRYRIFVFKNFQFPKFLREINSIVYNLSEYIDPASEYKKNESPSDWLKRIPQKYAIRHSKYVYTMALSMYIEASIKDKIYDRKKFTKKEEKEFKELINSSRRLYDQTKELYEEVLIRARTYS